MRSSRAEQGSSQPGSRHQTIGNSHSDLALIPSAQPPSSETTGPGSLDSEGSSSIGQQRGATTAVAQRSADLAAGTNLEELLGSMPYSLMRLVDVDSDHWTKPDNLTISEIQSSKGWLSRAEGLLKPADKQLVAKWLGALGVLCAGQLTAADAKVKIAAYAPLLDCPASVLTKRTLADAGRAFKWFPSFAEVSEFLDGRTWAMRKLAARLKQLAETTPELEHQPGSDWKDLTPEQQFEIDRKLKEVKATLDGLSNTLKGVASTPA
jgi:hypothetical protein